MIEHDDSLQRRDGDVVSPSEGPIVCPVCGALLSADWDVAFMDADREFFEIHPNALRFRRPAFPGEHPFVAECSGRVLIVEVTAVAPGVRTRMGCEVAVDPVLQTSRVLQ